MRWADTLRIDTVMQKLKKYEGLGVRYQPTDLLKKMAAKDKGFAGPPPAGRAPYLPSSG